MNNETSGILMQFDIKDSKVFKKKIENSRRFMFGSLMCFTLNNFKSVIFGKIVDRKPELLTKGQLVIEFDPIYNVKCDVNYIMVESSIYFEPYYHVLNALQQLHEDNFPMKKYIVEVCNDKEQPRYPASPVSELDVDQDDDEYDNQLNVANVIKIHKQLLENLNEAQHKACYSAMNESFSIIQGPPGTGKTYLGLVIAKLLLNKKMEWYHGRYPLLVVCFTNHALDQFLEGLIPATNKIVRIGGQSKNENLEQYNLRNVRKTSTRTSTYAFIEARHNVQIIQNILGNLHNSLDIANQFLGIVDILDILKSEPELLGTWFGDVTEKEFRNWLFGEKTHRGGREVLKVRRKH